MPSFAEGKDSRKIDVVTIKLGNYTFRLPANYIHSYFPQKTQNGPAALSISVLYPGLEPMTEENQSEFLKPGFNRVIKIYLFYNEGYADNELLKSIYKNEIDKNFPSNTYGIFTVYRTNNYVFRQLYEYNDGSTDYNFLCTDDEKGRNPFCQFLTKIGDNLELSYTYNKNFLDNSINLEENIIKMISSFYSKNASLNK